MNEYLKEELHDFEETETETRKEFVIDDLSGLTWAFRKLSAINQEIKEINQVAEAERERINQWEKKKVGVLQQSVEFFEYKIKEYHYKEMLKDPKKKSISTPYGKAKSVTKKAQPKIKDEYKLLDYLKLNSPEFWYTEEKINWGELKKSLHVVERGEELIVIDESGQLVEGVEVEEANTNFKLEVD